MDLELKPLPNHLDYAFLEEPSFLLVIISSQLFEQNKNKLVYVLKRHKQAFAWNTTDIPGIYPSSCKHKIQLLEDKKPVVQKQRRLNPNMQEVVKKEIVKLLDTGIIYPIADSPWVQFRRTSLTGFPTQSVRSSNADTLDSPYLLVLITRTSQSRQHGFPFVTINTKEYHSECSGRIIRIMRRNLVNSLLDLYDLVLVIEGWSRLPPIQYQLTQSEKVNRSRVDLRDK
ncbi:hypothetical protein Tco_0664361 [Tanacetum coccineum]